MSKKRVRHWAEQIIKKLRDFDSVVGGRQEHALPILHEFKAWLDQESTDGRILPKSPIRAAFTYTLNQWEALVRYTEQGYLSFDNNVAAPTGMSRIETHDFRERNLW